MRSLITDVVCEMETPSQALRAEAKSQGGDQAFNDHVEATWPCLTTLEHKAPGVALPKPHSLVVAAWNIERCKCVEDSAELLRRTGADVVLATEMDLGMARSHQRHTTRDLADCLGFGYVFGTEFVELGTGDPYETSLFADVPNRHGLHGNALLSRYPLSNLKLIPLDRGGIWFVGQPKNDGQLRLGGRMALCASVETTAGPIELVSVHYESESTADERTQQTDILLSEVMAGNPGSVIVGGDLNTKAFTEASLSGFDIVSNPAPTEPSFAVFAQHGFDWRTANTGAFTTRAAPGRPVQYPLLHLDWLFGRRVHWQDPQVWPAVSDRGAYLSDHELITARAKVATK